MAKINVGSIGCELDRGAIALYDWRGDRVGVSYELLELFEKPGFLRKWRFAKSH